TLVALDDVVILRREVLKGNQMLIQRMAALGPDRRPTAADIAEIQREIEADPTAGDLAEVWYSKAIQLSSTYHFSYAEHPAREGVTGFGFTSGIGPVQREAAGCSLTFSWEWFQVKSPGVADKLQESGTLSFEQKERACGHELVKMVFETDVSFRIITHGGASSMEPKWRIKIHKGSEILWPSLVDGRNSSNGLIP
ncbi:MAG: hypothetical protein ACAH95_02675, partial [Fimbriimonas sp.]